MKNSKVKALALATLTGGTLFGGCLGGWSWQRLFWETALYAGSEFVLDNDAVVDLFDDGDRDTNADGTLNNDGDN